MLLRNLADQPLWSPRERFYLRKVILMTPGLPVPKTVLLVEDDPDIRSFVQLILEQGGLRTQLTGLAFPLAWT
jgi:hypothetical protein